MKHRNSYWVVLSVFTGFLLTGCATNLTPMEVSDQFWTAVKNGDDQSIKKYILKRPGNNAELSDDILPINNYSLGRTVIDKEQAWIDTTVEIAADDPVSIPIKTVLQKQENQWKVDYAATIAPLSNSSDIARLLGNLNDLGMQFTDKLNQSLGELQRNLPDIQKQLEKIEENMKQKLPELQQRMDELMRQLEEALGNKKQRQAPPSGTREI